MLLELLSIFISTSFAVNTNFPEPVGSYLNCIINEYCSELGGKIKENDDRFSFSTQVCNDTFKENQRSDITFLSTKKNTISLQIRFKNKDKVTPYFYAGNPCAPGEFASYKPDIKEKKIENTSDIDDDDDSPFASLSNALKALDKCKPHEILNSDEKCVAYCSPGLIASEDPIIQRTNDLSDKVYGILGDIDMPSRPILESTKEPGLCLTCNQIYPDSDKSLRYKDKECLGYDDCPPFQENISVTDKKSGKQSNECVSVCPDNSKRDVDNNCYFKNAKDYCLSQVTGIENLIKSFKKEYKFLPFHESCEVAKYKVFIEGIFSSYETQISDFVTKCTMDLNIQKLPRIRENAGPHFSPLAPVLTYTQKTTIARCFRDMNASAYSKDAEIFIMYYIFKRGY